MLSLRIYLGLLVAIAFVVGTGTAARASSEECWGDGWTGNCTTSNSGTQVDVGANAGLPGGSTGNGSGSEGAETSGAGYSGGSGSGEPDSGGGNSPGSTSDTASASEDCPDIGCRGNYTVVTIPDVTISDLASFIPHRPSVTGEPLGYGIAGAPANLIGAASTHVLSGPLLGWDVTVRFVPVGYVFDHGDGTSARTTTGGTSWASLGLPQLSPTATSHVYGSPGRYTVTLRVEYAASVDFGTGRWRPVSGVVTSRPATYDLTVLTLRTALVERTCLESPAGPGC
ncbi:hypothetical protein GCM10009808_10180 [Microbacterium sediminicola]|uniref:PKD domain-containing protein n=1 Tax=Microbacterium sediminicola TaxID=415210 RepID=A0ABP4TW81_9MICO